MAERLGVTQPTYQAKEKPDANMRRKTLEKIADALGIDYGQLDIWVSFAEPAKIVDARHYYTVDRDGVSGMLSN